MLRRLGWQGAAEDANLHAPAVVEEIHRGFRQAGADVLLTNTFLLGSRSADEVPALVDAAVARARASAAGAFVAGSIGPSASASREDARAIGAAFARAGVDAIWFETFPARYVDPTVTFAEAVLETWPGPVLFSCFPAVILSQPAIGGFLSQLGGRAFESVGLNCGEGPDETILAVGGAAWFGEIVRGGPPLSLRPSAGLPAGEGRGLEWPATPERFEAFARQARALGARILGGCCGATPEHIARVAAVARGTR